jgi:hypothetical protein
LEDFLMLELTMLSPLPAYLDECINGIGLAPRPAGLDGKVLGLLPNWRPSAVEILQGVGVALGQRFRLDSVVMEQPMREVPISKGKVIDAMRENLDEIARRIDVAVVATGD